MIPNMFKIAGELTPTVFHVSARTVATHALSIFGDHSDVMATRTTGFAMLASNSVQEVHDFAVIAQAASLASRVPFLHFFDGFRTSHEVQKIEELTERGSRGHDGRGAHPRAPRAGPLARPPGAARHGAEPRRLLPGAGAGESLLRRLCRARAGGDGQVRRDHRTAYHLFDYVGAPDAERVIILMGSGAETVHETVEYLNARGEKVGVLKVRLFRPFDGRGLVRALPATVEDRRPRPHQGAGRDGRAALPGRGHGPGRGPGLRHLPLPAGAASSSAAATVSPRRSSTPPWWRESSTSCRQDRPKNHFTIGIEDDVSHTSLP